MAIEKHYNGRCSYNGGRCNYGYYYTLVCDHCGKEAGYFDDFYEAVDEKKSYGFKSVNTNGVWADICEECQDMMQYKQGTATAAEDFAGLV